MPSVTEIEAVRLTGDRTLVTARSVFTGLPNTMVLNMPLEAFEEAMDKFRKGVLIQHAFPTLNRDQCEMIMTGSTPDEWDNFVPGDEEESRYG
jgi:hypothetical protein